MVETEKVCRIEPLFFLLETKSLDMDSIVVLLTVPELTLESLHIEQQYINGSVFAFEFRDPKMLNKL
jgi:hypothetical protein